MLDPEILVALRKSKELSQTDLARAAGVSQATISRIEAGEVSPTLKVLAKLARVFDLQVRDLVEGDDLRELTGQENLQEFYAFCPNPMCSRNAVEGKDGQPVVHWKSGQKHPVHRFDAVNFCTRCGNELVKECPNCERRLEDAGSRFCIACGSQLTERPTAEEWQELNKLLGYPSDPASGGN